VSLWLFAYGSNMAEREMWEFAPGARFAGLARLSGFALELRRRSIRWGGGAADIVERPGDEVWGVLYELPDGDLAELDDKEGAGWAYRRREVEVETEGGTRAAIAYEVIEKEPEQVAATPEYAELLLRAARERELPADYVTALEGRLKPRQSR
jgi:gamma-glutamylcyclotransferase